MFSPFKWASQVAQWQSLPANPGDAVHSLGREDPLQKEMVTHSSVLAWRIPWTEKATVYGVAESDTTERLHYTLYCLPLGISTSQGPPSMISH